MTSRQKYEIINDIKKIEGGRVNGLREWNFSKKITY